MTSGTQVASPAHVRTRDLFVLSFYGLALSMTASVFDPPVYTAKVNHLLANDGWRNTVLGLMTFAGLVVAAISQPIWGALSDCSTARWGRRIPFLVGGSLTNLVLFTLVAIAGDVWLLALVVLGLQLSSNAVQGAYQGLIPDQVPPAQRGVAAGAKSLMELSAVVIGPVTAGFILARGDWPLTTRVLGVVGVVQIVYVVVTLITLWRVKDASPPASGPRASVWRTIRNTFRVDWRRNRDLRWWLINRFLFWFALLTLRSFLINYLEQVIGLSADEAQRATGILGAVLGGLIFFAVLPSGYLADRVGSRPLLIVSGIVAALGAFVLMLARSVPVVFCSGIFIGLGGGLYVTSSWALATDLVPQEQAARYLGITNLATAGGSAAARLTGPVIDGVNHLVGSKTIGYVGVYALGGILFLMSSLVIGRVVDQRSAKHAIRKKRDAPGAPRFS